jgi:cobyrinic acid a,c-diamide synthase
MTAAGLIVAAPSSGAGKTTVTLGLMRALRRRGVAVRGLKSGPDYIDPAFHRAATGADSFNLDSFAMPPALLDSIVAMAAEGSELLIAEGAMGLFDGLNGPEGQRGAAADLARRYGWPVLLVIDCRAMAQTAGAIALGLARFDAHVEIAGVVLNNVASDRHRLSIEHGLAAARLPVLGIMPRDAEIRLPERHLGLVQAGELATLEALLEKLADAAERHFALGEIAALARARPIRSVDSTIALPPLGKDIAIARDAAFSFIYPHIIAGWRASGANITYFSPLADEAPPADCDACFLPGGYPELHAATLADARHFMRGLEVFARTRPVRGECGGYMVLGEELIGANGAAYRMAGLLPLVTSFAERRLHLGYRRAALIHDGPFGPAGTKLAGHEFHYATLKSAEPRDEEAFAAIEDGEGRRLGHAGHCLGNVSGTFFHAIALSESGASC